MNRPLGIGALLLIPALAALFHGLGQSGLRTMTGIFLGIAVYWALLALALVRCGGWSLRLRPPGLPVTLALVGLVAAAAWDWGGTLAALSPHVLAAVILAALLNGTLEEAFWRGALIPRPGPWAQIGACLLFLVWHLAPAALLSGQGAVRLLLGAALVAPFMMAARLGSGTAGAGALAHALMNLLAFSAMAAGHGRPV